MFAELTPPLPPLNNSLSVSRTEGLYEQNRQLLGAGLPTAATGGAVMNTHMLEIYEQMFSRTPQIFRYIYDGVTIVCKQ